GIWKRDSLSELRDTPEADILVNAARVIDPPGQLSGKFLERSPNSLALSTSKTTRYVRLRYVRLVSALPLRLVQKLPGS
ncbi:MAG: hypothetical protein WBW33_11355, partial [Bryobacteraceae bacterium]